VPKFVIKRDQSLFAPIEVEINGKTFTVARITRAVLRKLEELSNAAKAAQATGTVDIESPYRQLDLLLGEHPEIAEIDLREAGEVLKFITSEILRSERMPMAGLGDEEKNVSKLGGESLH
jgi:hypothetical protein